MGAELTPQQCCEVCGADAVCAAAVWRVGHNKWTGQPLGQCILKAASDVAHKVARANYTAIVPAPRSAWQTVTIAAAVPGDLVTDLERAGVIADPLFGTNFKNASVWNGPVWNCSTTFDRPSGGATGQLGQLLVFTGIKMGARVWLNGRLLGNASDQHRRYVFPVSDVLRRFDNQLTVSFDSSVDLSAGRFMGCSGGWDWAPYSNARDPNSGLPVFTKGVWKSVYLVSLRTALLGANVPTGTGCGTFASLVQSAPGCDPTTCYLDVRVHPSSGSLSRSSSAGTPNSGTGDVLYGHNELLLAAPLQLKLPALQLEVEAATQAAVDDGGVAVTVTADRVGVAAYVWLSTLAAGRFEPNGFMLGADGAKRAEVKFIPFGQQPVDVPTLRASVRVEHLGQHLGSS